MKEKLRTNKYLSCKYLTDMNVYVTLQNPAILAFEFSALSPREKYHISTKRSLFLYFQHEFLLE